MSEHEQAAQRRAAISMTLGAGRGWGGGAADVVVTYTLADISYEATVSVGKGGGRGYRYPRFELIPSISDCDNIAYTQATFRCGFVSLSEICTAGS
jgi:hypothetical protein